MQKVHAADSQSNPTSFGIGTKKFAIGTSGSGATTGTPVSGAGALLRAVVSAAGSGSGQGIIYDGVDNTGVPIGYFDATATATVGKVYTFLMPFTVGIFFSNPTNGPVMSASYEQ